MIAPGHSFDTPHEMNCIVKTEPDELGNFLGWDSDNVICQYNTVMITWSSNEPVVDLPKED